MSFDPKHGHGALRRGRWSESSVEYFLTFCTADRKPGLAEPILLIAISSTIERLTKESAWNVRTGVVMPDHLHLLVAVGPKSSLAATVRLFKGRLMPALRKAGLQWQPAYFDHRMRPTEERLPVFRYLFLNPYRAGLIARNEKWPGYYCCPGDWAWFSSLVENDCPVPEWLA